MRSETMVTHPDVMSGCVTIDFMTETKGGLSA
jgi:hypothetical protein